MFIATAHNITPGAQREDGTADYDVWVGINDLCIWRGCVNGHLRRRGAVVLLREIADAMEIKIMERAAHKKTGQS